MDTPEFGRAMYKYAKRLGKHNQSQKGKSSQLPESKSDSDIKKTDNLMRSCLSSSKSQPSFGKSHNKHQQQCCSGFGPSNRNRLHNNACSLL